MFRAISGTRFADRRDLALLRFMFDTGTRVGEVLQLRVDDVDLDAAIALVYGKGRRRRIVPFGSKTTAALAAYMRARRKHRLTDLDVLWLGPRGPLLYNATWRLVRRRGAAVGMSLHPHQARHYFAHRWLADGGNESDLRSIGGWESPLVMRRYGKSAAVERAIAAHRRASPGDRL
jgi:site-specific recombinase XerD